MFIFTQDEFLGFGDELTRAAIVAFQQALADHASTVDVPAPTAHPIIEMIVRQHGGTFTVLPPPEPGETPRDFGTEIDALKADVAFLLELGGVVGPSGMGVK